MFRLIDPSSGQIQNHRTGTFSEYVPQRTFVINIKN